jgi:hypothetical protein
VANGNAGTTRAVGRAAAGSRMRTAAESCPRHRPDCGIGIDIAIEFKTAGEGLRGTSAGLSQKLK